MKHRRSPILGVTLLETILYIALLAIIFPPTVAALLRLSQETSLYDVQHRMDAQAGTVLSQLTIDLTQARSVSVSQSTLTSDPSSLRFTDSAGTTVIVDRPTTTVTLNGGSQTIRRLRMQRGSAAPFWLTDPDIDVSSFTVQAVRNASSVLTGLRFHLSAVMPNASANPPYRRADFVSDVTVGLQPQTTET